MTEHLLISTVVLALAMAAARILPLTARTRYAVLLCGLAKFAVPTAVFRFLPAEAIPEPLRILGGGTNANVLAPQATASIDWIPIVWASIALMLILRWMLLRTRTVTAALRSPGAASPRELAAVSATRAAMGIRVAVDTIRSPLCEAPAVLRVVRPVIALPAQGCDDLTDDELRSLVLHECAHVARHDNLATIVQALATSLLWFHPLVWITSRMLTTAREESCDEAVADAMHETDAYVSALTKICHAIAAPRTAGASCMASAQIKERMEHLMSYETIKTKAWSHRAMLVLAVLLLGFSTIATATSPNASAQDRYRLEYTLDRLSTRQLQFNITVTEIATGEIVMQPRMTTPPEVTATARTGRSTHDQNELDLYVKMLGKADGSSSVSLDIHQNDQLIQHTDLAFAPGAAPRRYTGDPISMRLKDADLRDVMNTFGDLTGMTVIVDPDAQASVTVDVVDIPWDMAMENMLNKHGLLATVEGKTIHVSKQKP